MIKFDRTAEIQLSEILELLDETDAGACQFWACDGPNAPYRYGHTCAPCRAVQLSRRLAARIHR